MKLSECKVLDFRPEASRLMSGKNLPEDDWRVEILMSLENAYLKGLMQNGRPGEKNEQSK